MNISFECLTATASAACYVRQQVFGKEWHLTVPELSACDPERHLTLRARDTTSHQPAAALSVLETTGNAELHRRFGLSFFARERAARDSQLAVLGAYRGMNLPVRLIIELRRRFVGPKPICYTWLMFNAERAKTSALCELLGFAATMLCAHPASYCEAEL
jgi:hypothetical protein